MALDNLGSKLKETLAKITKSNYVDQKLINELIKDIQKALLQSDVNVELVFKLTNEIKKRAEKEDSPGALTKKEHLINIVYEELVKFVGEEEEKIDETKKPTKIMLVGLYGSGKTTTTSKIAKFYKNRGKKVAVIQTDTWRPAAFQQLQQLAKQNGIPFYGTFGEKNPSKIYKTYENELNKFDIVVIDTAGRDALSEDLVEELDQISKVVMANEKLLVMSADVGQGAKKQAEFFHNTCNITGVIITKLDGSAKGGGALTACSVTNAKVKFIGIGEKVDDFEIFSPERFISRLLGMGDLQSLIEKAKDAISEDEAQDLGAKLLKGEFSLLDMYNQMEAMSKMGPLGKVMEMIPGMSKMQIPKEMLASSEEDMKIWKHIMNSMTKKELEDPEIVTSERVDRIALGCGQDVSHVRKLLKQFKQSKKMIKMFKGGGNKKMKQMMKQFGGMDPSQLGM